MSSADDPYAASGLTSQQREQLNEAGRREMQDEMIQQASILSLRPRVREYRDEIESSEGPSGPQGMMESERRRETEAQPCESSSDDNWGTWEAVDSTPPCSATQAGQAFKTGLAR